MATLKKHDWKGQEVGEIELDDTFLAFEASSQMIKDYIVAIRANMRQWSANTKGRSQVRCSGKKIGPQKGSGGARHGAKSAPQFRGGGVVFGPKPKFNQHTRINKKERRAAIRYLLAEAIQQGKVIVLSGESMEKPKTRQVAQFLNFVGISGRALFVGEGAYDVIGDEEFQLSFTAPSPKYDALRLSVNNLPKVRFSLLKNLSGLDLALPQTIVIAEEALPEMLEWLA